MTVCLSPPEAWVSSVHASSPKAGGDLLWPGEHRRAGHRQVGMCRQMQLVSDDMPMSLSSSLLQIEFRSRWREASVKIGVEAL